MPDGSPGTGSVRASVFPVGVAYYPLTEERQTAADWYARDPEPDFRAFAAAGFSVVRVFMSWRYFEPQVGQYEAEADRRLAALVEAARSHRVMLVVTFFASDGLAELVDTPWSRGRDPLTDAYLIGREAAFVARVVRALRAEDAVFAWDLCDEAFASRFASAEDLAAWAGAMREAVREVDVDRPVTMGVDAETLRAATGVDARSVLDELTFVVSHTTSGYRVLAAEGPLTARPATFLDAFLLHAARGALPVLCDGVGVLSLDHSAAEEAAHVRLALYGAVMNGAAGAVLRRDRDAVTERREPYYRDPREVLVGLSDAEGEAKPALAEASAFAAACRRLARGGYAIPAERSAVLMPAERWDPLPSLAGLHTPRSCLQAFITAKEAHVPVTVAREDGELDGFRMLVVPSAGGLGKATWQRLAAFVQGGGSLFVSYGGGDVDPSAQALFGVASLGDDGPRRQVSCRVAQPGMLGPLTSFDAALPVEHFALLGRGDAIVVATDETGNPLLTVNQFGQGRAVFMALPAERALALPDTWGALSPVRDALRAVYSSLAGVAGAAAPYACDRPEVEVALLSGDADDALLALNHAPDRCTATFSFERTVAVVTDLRGGDPVPVAGTSFAVVLEPFGAAMLRVSYA